MTSKWTLTFFAFATVSRALCTPLPGNPTHIHPITARPCFAAARLITAFGKRQCIYNNKEKTVRAERETAESYPIWWERGRERRIIAVSLRNQGLRLMMTDWSNKCFCPTQYLRKMALLRDSCLSCLFSYAPHIHHSCQYTSTRSMTFISSWEIYCC